MSDLNDLNKPTPTDTEPNVLDTLRAHIIRAATWSGWSATGNKVAGIMSAVTAAVSGGRSLRLYRRNDTNTEDEEVVSLPGVSIGGNSATATALATARSIGGVSFNGTANIDLPGVNAAGNQSTTGNAATATKLATARTIGGVSFDGSASINLPGVNQAGNQNTSGNAATATTAGSCTGNAASASSVPWSGVSGRPTAVSAFTNDAGYLTNATAPAPNTTNVLAATAGAAVGDVGTYAMCAYQTAASPLVAGTTIAGSSLVYAGVASTGGAVPAGTWRIMGAAQSNSSQSRVSLFLRIA